MISHKLLFRFFLTLDFIFLALAPASAQIIPDSSLRRESSIVSPARAINKSLNRRIEGGARRGDNLFHSFREFSIPVGSAVYFANPSGIRNILSRVTGNSSSNIQGKLGVLGDANLFLVNPSGIVIGPTAKLDVGGSFLATTATGVELLDGIEFSANEPEPVPLLSVNVPAGLNFQDSPGSIAVQGPGHNLVQPDRNSLSNLAPPIGSIQTGFGVAPGQTLALVGGDVSFTGGIVTAFSGRIEIGSVRSGKVNINSNNQEGLTLDYKKVPIFQDIRLTRLSLVNASGSKNGNIQIFGKNIELTDKSLVSIRNLGSNPLGAININASDSLTITGTTEFTPTFTDLSRSAGGLNTETFSGKGPDITISTKQLIVRDSGGILPITYGSGPSGNISINASESIDIFGTSPPPTPFGSVIATSTVGSGKSGDVQVFTKYLSIRDGGLLQAAVINNGTGGDVFVNATESIELAGVTPVSLTPSSLSTLATSSGDGGNLTVNTRKLNIKGGGRLDSSTLASGNAGSLVVNASDSIRVSGTVSGSVNPSLIISSANIVDPILRQILGLPEIPTGASGSIKISTPELVVNDGARVAVSNDGTGNAGEVRVNAETVDLENGGEITASTADGDGGNIELQVQDLVILQNNSSITASAQGSGNGGNLRINTALLTALNNSAIRANAQQGRGGEVVVNTQGLLLSPESEITATSQLGPEFEGNVVINTPDIDLSRTAAEPRAGPETPSVRTSCQSSSISSESNLVNAGRGVPSNGFDTLPEREGWQVPSSTPQASQDISLTSDRSVTEPQEQFVQSTGWIRNSDGTVDFVAETSKGPSPRPHSNQACSQANNSDSAQ